MTSGRTCFARSSSSMPFMPGMRWSLTMTAGSSERSWASAASPPTA